MTKEILICKDRIEAEKYLKKEVQIFFNLFN